MIPFKILRKRQAGGVLPVSASQSKYSTKQGKGKEEKRIREAFYMHKRMLPHKGKCAICARAFLYTWHNMKKKYKNPLLLSGRWVIVATSTTKHDRNKAMQTESLIGKELVCHVTGKKFIGAIDGCTTNYARDIKGNVYSDEGVNISELEEIKDRTKPFTAYLSSDGKHITGWKGNELMRVVYTYQSNAGFAGWRKDGGQIIVRAIDKQGFEWYGRNAGKGMVITLRPAKHKTK